VVKRTVFLGTPQFAVPTLKAMLISPEIKVLAVITQPDQKSGRGQKLVPPPVKVLAMEHDIPVSLDQEKSRRIFST
jgi:methionyl-tRNA formyltransferase